MMKGSGDDNDAGEVSAVMPWRKPWWRSVGFWMGLWVLAFLVWVGVDSYTNVWRVMRPVTLSVPHQGHTTVAKEVLLQGGAVLVGRARISEPPAGITVTERKLFAHRSEGSVWMVGMGWWGSRRVVEEVGNSFRGQAEPNPFAGITVDRQQWWFPYGLVVLAYVGGWICSMRWWRRRMRRRWERAQVVEVMS